MIFRHGGWELSDVIERACRAICEIEGSHPDKPVFSGYDADGEHLWVTKRKVVLAVLKAIGNPNDAMMNAGGNCMIPDRGGQPAHAASCWRSMLAVIVSEETEIVRPILLRRGD